MVPPGYLHENYKVLLGLYKDIQGKWLLHVHTHIHTAHTNALDYWEYGLRLLFFLFVLVAATCHNNYACNIHTLCLQYFFIVVLFKLLFPVLRIVASHEDMAWRDEVHCSPASGPSWPVEECDSHGRPEPLNLWTQLFSWLYSLLQASPCSDLAILNGYKCLHWESNRNR